MSIRSLKPFERALRSARDRLIAKRLAASPWVRRQADSRFKLVVQQFDDHHIAFDPADKVVGHHVAKFGDWFRDDFRRVLALLAGAGRITRGKIFFDVGANIGTQTVYALVGGDFAGAVCFEPVPRNVMALRANIAINDLGGRAKVVPMAVGAAAGSMQIIIDGENSGAHSFRSGLSTGPKSSLPVDMTTIDAMLAALGIDPANVGLLWLDVEGYEPEALAGASHLLAARVPICIEFNSTAYGEAGTGALLALLTGAGYRTAIRIDSDTPRSFTLPDIDRRYLPGDFLLL